MSNLISRCKKMLNDRWGHPGFPAEWDGRHLGGGKGSQRYWEYLWAIDQLEDFDISKQILDIGCGRDMFFSQILRDQNLDLFSVDPALDQSMVFIRAIKSDLSSFAGQTNTDAYGLVFCLSVMEHMDNHDVFCFNLSLFDRARIVITLEHGDDPAKFAYQVTPPKFHRILGKITNHYLSKIERCPIWCENSKDQWRPLGIVLEPFR